MKERGGQRKKRLKDKKEEEEIGGSGIYSVERKTRLRKLMSERRCLKSRKVAEQKTKIGMHFKKIKKKFSNKIALNFK